MIGEPRSILFSPLALHCAPHGGHERRGGGQPTAVEAMRTGTMCCRMASTRSSATPAGTGAAGFAGCATSCLAAELVRFGSCDLLRSRDDVVLASSSGPVCTFEQELCADSTLVSYFKETGSYCAKSLRRGASCVTKFGQVVYAALPWATLSRRTCHQRRWVHVRLQSGALRLVCLCARAWHLLVLQLWPATYTLRKSSLLSSSGETLFVALAGETAGCSRAFMMRAAKLSCDGA